jgi:hypothetical protein
MEAPELGTGKERRKRERDRRRAGRSVSRRRVRTWE